MGWTNGGIIGTSRAGKCFDAGVVGDVCWSAAGGVDGFCRVCKGAVGGAIRRGVAEVKRVGVASDKGNGVAAAPAAKGTDRIQTCGWILGRGVSRESVGGK